MEKHIIIIDEFFPFLKKEPFLEAEIKYYDKFNVHIFSCSADNSMVSRQINQKNVNYYAQTKEKYRWTKIFRYINSIFSIDFFHELIYLTKNKNLNFSTLKNLMSFMSTALYKSKWISKELKCLGFNDDTELIIYSYWMHFHAYTALQLKKEYKSSKIISRCHGFDLYEYRNERNYIPLRNKILSDIDEIYSISDNGKHYLDHKYPDFKKNIKVSRLGTIDYGWTKSTSDRTILKVVSCSWLVSVKRVHRIISTLEKLDSIYIEWTHFGDGELYEDIKQEAYEKLSKKNNIKYHLEGAISNKGILKKYQEDDFHVFINVSKSEGVPVSIMEALSFGIPVIATNVGGTSEIVFDSKNGYLLDENFLDDQLIYYLKKLYYLSSDEYFSLRENSRLLWEQNFNADINYFNFVNNLISE